MNKKSWLLVFLVSILLILIGAFIFMKDEPNNIVKEKEKIGEKDTRSDTEDKVISFNSDLIKYVHQKKNYLISPYSIEMALNMLRDGADGNTKKEIDRVIGNRKMNNIEIPNKLNIANAIFVKDYYQNKVKDSYYNRLKNDYGAEVLFDKFNTPDVINNWVNEKTKGMIPSILDTIDPSFALGLANAISLDVEWQSEFECNNTRETTFTKNDGTTINVEMMNQTYRSGDYKYIDKDNMKGIVLPYRKSDDSNTLLEFVGLMPDDIEKYINSLDEDSFKKIDELMEEASDDVRINLALPRFEYAYEIDNFINVLQKMGIKDVFNASSADLTRIMDKKDMDGNLYVDDAIHKTKIELNEKGTKAAAVTFFGMKASGIIIEKEFRTVNITFDKPFIYLIRDQKTKEIIFFGMVNEPNLWQGTTCKN